MIIPLHFPEGLNLGVSFGFDSETSRFEGRSPLSSTQYAATLLRKQFSPLLKIGLRTDGSRSEKKRSRPTLSDSSLRRSRLALP